MYIYSNVTAGLLYVETAAPLDSYRISDVNGNEVNCPKLRCKQKDGGYVTTLDASELEPWSFNTPVLYTLEAEGEALRFGHTQIRTLQNKMILLNEKPIYLRGYIRGIVAHEHPTMTGGSDYEAACKNIRQAKKYGFNIVRFHSTIPSDDFIRAADELGMLVHLETGFKYKWLYNEQNRPMKKVVESFGETLWEDTILRLRNHPSIAVFCIGNEMHRSSHYPEVHAMIKKGREPASSKLIMDNCGWGEYDRDSADMYIQHMGYYLPYTHHNDMFTTDALWKLDASAYDVPLRIASREGSIIRCCDPLKPVLAHESMHYIDIPDYAASEKKFDEFCQRVGPEHLEKHEIKKPKYFAGIQKLIQQRGLAERNTWDMQGAMERFKPCIWDRGHGLGGILPNKAVEEVLGNDKYFDRNVQPLLDVGSKVNLDNWPCKVTEHVMGVDKPVRDRYRASRDGVKDFVPENTLRRFSHLFSVKVGNGKLVVCTFNLKNPENPVVSNFLELLMDRTDVLGAETAISAEEFKAWLDKVNAAGFREEDTMNRSWQNDAEPVEKVLFWEDLNLNLAALK